MPAEHDRSTIVVPLEPVGGEPSASEDPRGPTRPRRRWWLVVALVVVLGAAAVVVNLQAGSDPLTDDAETADDDSEPDADGALPDRAEMPEVEAADSVPASQPDPDPADNEPADPGAGAELSEAFGEPEHPVSGVEPYIPSRVRPAELGPPAEVCLGTLPAYRVQLPLRFASTKPDGIDHVSWSPDCRRMVFRIGATLWTADGDGTGDMPFLTAQHGLSDPVWSPDGKWIAFSQNTTVDGERASQIFIVKPSGLGLTEVTWGGLVLDREPAWSPDGTRFAFSRRARAADGDGVDSIDQHLVMVELATDLDWIVSVGDGRPGTVHGGRQWELVAGGEHESWPAWSPDGESITYRSGDELILLRLDDLSQYVLLDDVVGTRGAWSPDGSRLAAWREWSADSATIVVSDLPGQYPGDQHVISLGGLEQASPTEAPTLQWSADGRRLFFYASDSPGSHWAYSIVVPEPARPPEYWAALATVENVLQEARYSEISAQHSVDVEAEFVVRGRAATTAVEAWIAFERSEPRGIFDAIENPHSDMPAVTRSDDRNGVWFTCNNLYGELLAQSLQQADALAATLMPALCATG